MNAIRKWFNSLVETHLWTGSPDLDPRQGLMILLLWTAVTVAIIYSTLHSHPVFAADSGGGAISLPGEDLSVNLKAAGILLKLLDTGIFKWGARLFAGLCIMSSAWALKEQRFGIAIICVVGAILFGTAPKWVSDIFSMGGNTGLFAPSSQLDLPSLEKICGEIREGKEIDYHA